jgi:signal transduction histidine kinase/ligand-binding sensor domain-containing protein
MNQTLNHKLLLLLLSTVLHATAGSQVLPLHTYSTKDGLISNAITAVMQDSRGYLWIGTNEGLSVYDGSTFANYTSVEGLSNNYITCILESRRHPGTVWIGTTQRGLTRSRNGILTRLLLGPTQNSNNVSSLAEDTAGTLWCGTSGGVFCVWNDTVRALQLDKPFSGGAVVAATPDGRIWLGSGRSILVYNTEGRLAATPDPGMQPGEFVDWLAADADGDVWLGTTRNDLKLFRNNRLVAERNFGRRVLGLLLDRSGLLWVSTSGEILRVRKSEFPDGAITSYGKERGFPETSTWLALEDAEGNLWFGTSSNGLLKLSERTLQSFPVQALTRDAAVDNRGHLWIPGYGGLWEAWKEKEERFQTLFHRVSEWAPGELGGPMAFDARGRLWISSEGGILRCYALPIDAGAAHPRLLFTREPAGGIPRGTPLSMIIDEGDTLCLSIEGGGFCILDLHDPHSTPMVLSYPRDIPLLSVRAIFRDSRRDLWLGGYGDGMAQLRITNGVPRVVRHFTMADGLPDNGIRAFAEDRAHRLWIGTRFGGVAVFDGRTFDTLSTRQGILSNAIWSIAPDTGGRMWLGTSSGLMYVNPGNLRDFGWTAGMTGNGVDYCTITRDGVVWFGNGLVSLSAYEPEDRMTPRVPPPVYITSLTVNDSAVSLNDLSPFPSDRNNVVIQFVGISFRDERSIRYQYRLNDNGWSRPGAHRTVSFAAMKPGEYTFAVRALAAGGMASDPPATLTFAVSPPFWQSWWFILLITLLVVSVAALLYRYRVGHLLEIERLRVRIAGDLHDDVGTNLSSILVTSQIMERQGQLSEQDRLQLKEIASIASTTQEMMRDIVWMLNPAHDSLDDLLLKMKETAAKLLSPLPYAFKAPHGTLSDKVSIEFKRNAFLIFKETLNNIIRHAEASRVEITVSHDDAHFSLRIHDDGRGFDPARRGSGMGLTSLRRRAEQIGGTLGIDSSPGRGTTISLVLKNHANT